jgi:hypothetical protein
LNRSNNWTVQYSEQMKRIAGSYFRTHTKSLTSNLMPLRSTIINTPPLRTRSIFNKQQKMRTFDPILLTCLMLYPFDPTLLTCLLLSPFWCKEEHLQWIEKWYTPQHNNVALNGLLNRCKEYCADESYVYKYAMIDNKNCLVVMRTLDPTQIIGKDVKFIDKKLAKNSTSGRLELIAIIDMQTLETMDCSFEKDRTVTAIGVIGCDDHGTFVIADKMNECDYVRNSCVHAHIKYFMSIEGAFYEAMEWNRPNDYTGYLFVLHDYYDCSYTNGSVHEIYRYVDGKKNGLYVKYNYDGVMECDGYYANDQPEGYWTEWHPNYRGSGGYLRGRKIGVWKYWDNFGKELPEEQYVWADKK